MYQPYKVPISIKGIVIEKNSVWLRKNERDEWELPGGKMGQREQPEETVVRELEEELGFKTKVISIIQAYLYTIKDSQDESKGVLVISYLCQFLKRTGNFETKGEAGPAKFRKFPLKEVANLNMPQFYKEAISKASKLNLP